MLIVAAISLNEPKNLEEKRGIVSKLNNWLDEKC